MRHALVLPCLLSLACSEYGLLGPRDHESDEAGSDDPGDPSVPHDDTDEQVPEDEIDCDLARTVKVEELQVYPGADFDDQGRMLAASPGGEGWDIIGVRLDNSFDVIASRPGHPRQPWAPRLLPDGNLAYLSFDHGSNDSYHRIGMFDPALNAQVAITAAAYNIRAIEPDADGTVYAFHYGDNLLHGGPEVRRYDLYSGFSHPIIDFDDDPYFLGQDIALSATSEVLYIAGTIPEDDKGLVYAVQRLGPWDWGDPVKIWAGGEVFGIAVDACDNLYISEGKTLLMLPKEANEALHIADLPGGLVQPAWGSGFGGWDSDVLYGYWQDWVGAQLGDVGFVAIGLDVDGTHILTR